jgi:hypothetical protein
MHCRLLAAAVVCGRVKSAACSPWPWTLVKLEPSLADLVAFFSDDEVSATVLDAAGKVLADGRADVAAGTEPGEAFAELVFGGQSLRLYLSRQQQKDEVAPPGLETDVAVTATESEEPDTSPPAAAAETTPSAEEATASPPSKQKPAEPPRDAPAVPTRGPRRLVVASKRPPPSPGFARPAASSVGAGAKAAQNSAALPKPPPTEATDPAEPPSRSITAGRVPRELSRNPVRFLWQTDGSDRFLFVSPGLAQVVGRNAEIVGERWQDAAGRLRLDPTLRIARAVAQRDTWSGQTAWWPVEGSNVRVPAELTALPIFGPDHSFQGYRGFGVLRPAEALMPAAFETRFGAVDQAEILAEQLPPYEEAVATSPAAATPANVVPIRADLERSADQARLTAQERSAFEEIAAALRDRVIQAPEGFGNTESAPEPIESAAPLERPAAPPEGEQETGVEREEAVSEAPEQAEGQADDQMASVFLEPAPDEPAPGAELSVEAVTASQPHAESAAEAESPRPEPGAPRTRSPRPPRRPQRHTPIRRRTPSNRIPSPPSPHPSGARRPWRVLRNAGSGS